MLDYTDRRLLALLQANARQGYQDLADAVGLSAPAAYQRVKKLEGAGVLAGYHARVDPAQVGLEVAAFLRVRPGPATDVAQLVAGWRASPEMLECHRLGADGAFLLKLRLAWPAGLGAHLEAARAAGCAPLADVALETPFERWTLPVAGAQH